MKNKTDRTRTGNFWRLLVFLAAISSVVHAAPGEIDTTFAGVGKLKIGFGFGYDYGRAGVRQPDGKIIVAGETNYQALIARYNPDGSLDTTFDGDGIFLNSFGFGIELHSIALQPDGKLIIAGAANVDFFAARLNSNGSIDTSFGNNGIVKTNIISYDYAYSVALQADGKIVLAGVANYLQSPRVGLVRYNPNGAPDTSFGNDGIVVTSVGLGGCRSYAAAIQPDGKIVAIVETSIGDFKVVRYLPNGSPDPSFDGDGIVTSDFGTREDIIRSIRLQPDGKIVAAGNHSTVMATGDDFAVARYNPNGSPDAEWGTGGIVFTDFNNTLDKLNAIALDRFGRVVAVGESNELIGMARYKSDVEAAVTALIGGRVVNASGRGIPNARITLSNSQGAIRTVATNPFGYYRFVGIPVGGDYFLTVKSKQIYTFAPSELTINLFEDYTQANFTGNMTAANLR
jgi:uncharacterized delta-60 repeat protein